VLCNNRGELAGPARSGVRFHPERAFRNVMNAAPLNTTVKGLIKFRGNFLMGISNLGLSNPYLKLGVALMVVGLVTVALASFFVVSSTRQATLHVGGLLLGSGIVVYFISRLAKAWPSK
jgi:hypothetical protein